LAGTDELIDLIFQQKAERFLETCAEDIDRFNNKAEKYQLY
jgi:hypothetical protein